jgi:RNA polymerase sigma factor (sigma-70 family)
MATSPINGVLQHLRRAIYLRADAGLTDGQLLECFVSRREEAALEALVRRHGPMVWGVCRRIMANRHDAEDAFQATFLVLVRKAASVIPRELVANWLHGVARQTALKARATIARRRAREGQVVDMPERAVAEKDHWSDLQPLLDQELSRLPDKYRVAVVLCDLEGKSRKEAARQLGLPEGTVASRLARARTMLAKRLAGRGVALSVGALATVLSEEAASASVPISGASLTIKVAALAAAGQATAAGLISAKVAGLTNGVLKVMLLNKLKWAALTLLVLAMGGFGGALFLPHGAARPSEVKSGQEPAPKKDADATKQERKKFEGTWRVVSCEVNGKKLKDFEGQVVYDAEGKWKQQTGDGTTLEEGTSLIDAGKKPRTIDFTVTKGDGKGTTLLAIYEFLGEGRYRVCIGGAERPEDFSTKPGSGRTLNVLQRVAVKKPPVGKKDDEAGKPLKDMDLIQGTWRVTKIEMGGNPKPNLPSKNEKWTVEKDRIKWSEINRPVTLSYSLDPAKNPKQIDMEMVEGFGTGARYKGIYKLEKGTLKCAITSKEKDGRRSSRARTNSAVTSPIIQWYWS